MTRNKTNADANAEANTVDAPFYAPVAARYHVALLDGQVLSLIPVSTASPRWLAQWKASWALCSFEVRLLKLDAQSRMLLDDVPF